MRTTEEKIQYAIKNQLRLELEINYSSGKPITIDFDPYILGDDILQYSFVWGFLPFNKVPYKLRLGDIIKVNKTYDQQFKVDSSMIYYYSIEEEHYFTAPDFALKNPRYNLGHTKINY